jgi:hypothetical protein
VVDQRRQDSEEAVVVVVVVVMVVVDVVGSGRGGEVPVCKKGFSKRVEEARMCGSEKRRFSGMAVAAITTTHRGRPTGVCTLPKPKACSPLSQPCQPCHAMAWHRPLQVRMRRHRAVRLFYRSSLC